MTHQEIREKFIKFFSAGGGSAFGGEVLKHKTVPSFSLLPTDSSVLFTTAGMQQFKPYYTGDGDAMKDFGSLNTVSIQKSMRTSDIDSVGDESHLTFFEMLGNFSFGGYWKKEAIEYAHEFITKEMGLKIDYVSVFGGESFDSVQDKSGSVPPDLESEKIWQSLDSSLEVKRAGRNDNFWGPTGSEGPCGPTTEIYVNGLEVWNIVFNEYYQSANKQLNPLKIKGIDTGMGLERLAMVSQGKTNIFETDLFEPLIQTLPDSLDLRKKRIISDHLRAAVFLIADGVTPSNKDQGYILRRLLRRAMVYDNQANLSPQVFENVLRKVIEMYGREYPEIKSKKDEIVNSYFAEWNKFKKALSSGIKELEKLGIIDAQSAFKLYESYGLPFEVIKEVGGDKASNLTRKDFETERIHHQEKSRAGAEKKFGGHGMTTSDPSTGSGLASEEARKKTRLHTATHIVVASLEKVLGESLKQAGADITAERLRFDFAFPRKVTPEELAEAEKIANQAVADNLEVWFEELSLEEAFASGAHGAFAYKYPPRVTVYTVGGKKGPDAKVGVDYFSREICGGPHVSHTAEIGHIKITKEESVSGGNRRIRAVIE
ncbi:MAG: alanine--tRNA ligase-related protein [Patescibacteria group bacterium]